MGFELCRSPAALLPQPRPLQEVPCPPRERRGAAQVQPAASQFGEEQGDVTHCLGGHGPGSKCPHPYGCIHTRRSHTPSWVKSQALPLWTAKPGSGAASSTASALGWARARAEDPHSERGHQPLRLATVLPLCPRPGWRDVTELSIQPGSRVPPAGVEPGPGGEKPPALPPLLLYHTERAVPTPCQPPMSATLPPRVFTDRQQ